MNNPGRVVPHSASKDAPTMSLAQEYFTSPEIHQRDLDRVFKRRWLFAGHASQILKAGDFFTYELDKDSVLIVRDKDARINAFHNVCRHRGSRICTEQSGNTKAFLCPYHNWVYGLDGRCRLRDSWVPTLTKLLMAPFPFGSSNGMA
jgi:Rieske 2Fe-2S family protein